MLHRNIVLPSGRHTASLIFLHGSGDTGVGIQSWVREVFQRIGDKQGFNFKQIKVIYPTAPPQPYTPLLGNMSNVWHDREKISYKAREIKKSVEAMTERLSEIIREEESAGIPPDRIVVGGFSMGGGMALHLAYGKHTNLRGAFALSSFLSEDSKVYDAMAERQKAGNGTLPDLFMCHGTRDPLVLYDWGKVTFEKLKSLGVKGEFHTVDYYHEIGSEEMVLVRDWVKKLLPDQPQNKL